MSTRFEEFLKKKSEGSGLKERRANRDEWLGALNRLLGQVRDWLQEADEEGLLEIVPYLVQSVEKRLGIYDAPAIKIRVGNGQVDFLPVGRFSIGPISESIMEGVLGVVTSGERAPIAGRVDITNGERKYLLLRAIDGGQDRWYAANQRTHVVPFDKNLLEDILQDLLS
jgi:hypothetical protein